MDYGGVFSRSLIRRATNTKLSLVSLEAIHEMREWLDELEVQALWSARDKGATIVDIAQAMGLTQQAIYYRIMSGDHQKEAGLAERQHRIALRPGYSGGKSFSTPSGGRISEVGLSRRSSGAKSR